MGQRGCGCEWRDLPPSCSRGSTLRLSPIAGHGGNLHVRCPEVPSDGPHCPVLLSGSLCRSLQRVAPRLSVPHCKFRWKCVPRTCAGSLSLRKGPRLSLATLRECGLSFQVSGRQSLEYEPHYREVAMSSHVGMDSVFVKVDCFFNLNEVSLILRRDFWPIRSCPIHVNSASL